MKSKFKMPKGWPKPDKLVDDGLAIDADIAAVVQHKLCHKKKGAWSIPCAQSLARIIAIGKRISHQFYPPDLRADLVQLVDESELLLRNRKAEHYPVLWQLKTEAETALAPR